MSPSLGPTAGGERYEFLDVLRGVALAGIVLANMISLSLYLYLSKGTAIGLPYGAAVPLQKMQPLSET